MSDPMPGRVLPTALPKLLVLAALIPPASGTASAAPPETSPREPDTAPKGPDTLIIAHRGASGYVPEHTLEGVALAHAQGADYIEQDVVLTRDDKPIVLHDIYLDEVTNVASKFPERARADGRFYAADFSLEEIRTLRVHERVNPSTGRQVFPHRFPADRGQFRVPTLEEEIELIEGLNASTGRRAGLYVEIKQPAWHRREGKDPSRVVLSTLQAYGYHTRDAACYLQCFDSDELRRLRGEFQCELKLIQLISNRSHSAGDGPALWSADGLALVRTYADGVGPDLRLLVERPEGSTTIEPSPLMTLAHRLGLEVHPYTFRADALPEFAATYSELVTLFVDRVGVDALFTDFPDTTRQLIRQPVAPGAK